MVSRYVLTSLVAVFIGFVLTQYTHFKPVIAKTLFDTVLSGRAKFLKRLSMMEKEQENDYQKDAQDIYKRLSAKNKVHHPYKLCSCRTY